ncbi:hypothetical protein PHOSAC3_121040 [Mesotoga infera]|nr:hypothetical protein PHOSAC3_121040 [Mesotoga infera]
MKLCQIKVRVCEVDTSYRSSLEKSFEQKMSNVQYTKQNPA